MDNVNKTLYIPLYGKATVSRKGIILHDPKAEEIWAREGFPLKGKSSSKWLAYTMGMRAAVFDQWLREQMADAEDTLVIHIGCGLDSRAQRVGLADARWFDVDFPDVIRERKRYYSETDAYRMLGADARDPAWLGCLPKAESALLVMEGVSMYLRQEELKALLRAAGEHFAHVRVLMDCYTSFGAKASRFKNPINDVGVTTVYGLDDPKTLEDGTGLSFMKEHEMTPGTLIDTLTGMEKTIFKKVFAGRMAKKIYRMYEYGKAESGI